MNDNLQKKIRNNDMIKCDLYGLRYLIAHPFGAIIRKLPRSSSERGTKAASSYDIASLSDVSRFCSLCCKSIEYA